MGRMALPPVGLRVVGPLVLCGKSAPPKRAVISTLLRPAPASSLVTPSSEKDEKAETLEDVYISGCSWGIAPDNFTLRTS